MSETEVVERVVARLRESRIEKGISQAELSRISGLSRSGIRHMEDGEVSPTLHFLLVVAGAIGVDLPRVLGEETR